jgi:hypothetical protein
LHNRDESFAQRETLTSLGGAYAIVALKTYHPITLAASPGTVWQSLCLKNVFENIELFSEMICTMSLLM